MPTFTAYPRVPVRLSSVAVAGGTSEHHSVVNNIAFGVELDRSYSALLEVCFGIAYVYPSAWIGCAFVDKRCSSIGIRVKRFFRLGAIKIGHFLSCYGNVLHCQAFGKIDIQFKNFQIAWLVGWLRSLNSNYRQRAGSKIATMTLMATILIFILL